MSETRAYNNDNTLASISFSGASIGNLSYDWDANKNKTSEGITGTMSGYGFDVGTSGYDVEDRLVSWERDDSNLDQSWNLSLVGDWNSTTENASVQSRTHGDTHELLTVAGQAVTHDAKGNQTVIPAILRPGSDPLAMKWDFENKLISADTDNDSVADVSYQWDALGRRVGRDDGTTVTVFVQSGQQTIADYTSGTAASSPTYDYVYASYIDEPVMRSGSGGNRYYHRNQQYSVIALTNGSGAIQERYAYDAYGGLTILSASLAPLTTSAENNRYTYTGREFDQALGMYHYRARMYDSATGRFCSRDPIGFEGGGANIYEYTLGNPVLRLDPTGYYWGWSDFFAHYYHGRGRTVTLRETGLAETWENYHSDAINGLLNEALGKAWGIAANCPSEGTFSDSGSSTKPQNFDSTLKPSLTPIGNTRINVAMKYEKIWTCKKCCDGSLKVVSESVTARIDLPFLDAFTNPFSFESDSPKQAKKQGECIYQCWIDHMKEHDFKGGYPAYERCKAGCKTKFPTKGDDGDPYAITHNTSRADTDFKSSPCD
ncbi:Rhs family protein [Rhodopirellula europaea SH398]|uniref:Rhs family protein n=1 Tax=Rhodopirellula europaea SH398 TaxID=1263868 RepID=M5SBV2_9BACT|nr:Rhs family protein [Rhodopirellula europaea SH398]